jgi:hypothetical protein
VLLQAGTLGEHCFTRVAYSVLASEYPGAVEAYAADPVTQDTAEIAVDGPYFRVMLPPGSEIRLEIGLERHANEPSYGWPEM